MRGLMLPQGYDQLELKSEFILDWQARDHLLLARTGQVGTFARASAGQATDSLGETYEVPPTLPRYQVTAGRVGLMVEPAAGERAVESLRFDVGSRIVPHTGYARFVERGTAQLNLGRIVHWGNAANNNPRFMAFASSTRYAAQFNPGTATSSVMGVGTTPSPGDLVQLWWHLYPDGSVRIRQAVNTGDPVDGPLSAANGTPPPQVASGQTIYIGSRGTTENGGSEIQVVRIHPDPEVPLGLLQAGTGLVVPGSEESQLVADFVATDPNFRAFVDLGAGYLGISET